MREVAMVCQEEWRVAMVWQVEERREATPQMEVGCLWWKVFLAMVCLVERWKVAKLEEVMVVQGMGESWS